MSEFVVMDFVILMIMFNASVGLLFYLWARKMSEELEEEELGFGECMKEEE